MFRNILLDKIATSNVKSYIILLLLIFLGFTICFAQENPSKNEKDSLNFQWERFSVRFGGFITGVNSDMNFGIKQLGLGININLEDALGLKTSTLALRGALEYNFGKRDRSSVRLGYFGLYRNASKILETDLEIGDTIFPPGTDVSSKLDIMIIKANYDYSFYMDKRVKLGFTVGLFILPISFSIDALGLTDNAVYFVAPLPIFGIKTSFAVTPKVFINQSIELLYLKIGTFSGNIMDLDLRIEYNPWKHIGFGLGVNSHRMTVQNYSEENNGFDFKGTIKTGYTGLLFFAKYYF